MQTLALSVKTSDGNTAQTVIGPLLKIESSSSDVSFVNSDIGKNYENLKAQVIYLTNSEEVSNVTIYSGTSMEPIGYCESESAYDEKADHAIKVSLQRSCARN